MRNQKDERILGLCHQLLDAEEVGRASTIGEELRNAIHGHVEALRRRVAESLYVLPQRSKRP